MTTYTVLRKSEGDFVLFGDVEAASSAAAVREAAKTLYESEGDTTDEGVSYQLVAIPARSFDVVRVAVEPEPRVTIQRTAT